LIVSATASSPSDAAGARPDTPGATRGGTAGAARWDTARGTASAALLLRYGTDLGVAPRACLRGTGLSPAELEDPRAEITAGQELAIVANLVAALGDVPGLGLGAGLRYGLQTYGIFGFAVLSSANLREAIAVAERFRELAYALVDVHLEMADGEVRIRLDAAAAPSEVRRFVIERDAAAITLIQRELFAEPVPLSAVTLAFEPPAELDPYLRTFGVLPEFGAAANLLVLDAALLDLPLPRASEFAAAQCQAQCQVLMDRRRRRVGVAGQVREALLADPHGMAGQAEVAAALNVSVRTLRRRLADEHTSFRAIVNETRMLLAQELLSTGQLTIEGVADRLGYAEASSFIHAFTRWSGVAPGRWLRASRSDRR
jgi:AraC-like DNA-binding protein